MNKIYLACLIILCILVLIPASMGYDLVTTDYVNNSQVTVNQLPGLIHGLMQSSTHATAQINLTVNGTIIDVKTATNGTAVVFDTTLLSSYGLKIIRINTRYNSTRDYYLRIEPKSTTSNEGYIAIAIIILGMIAFFLYAAEKIDYAFLAEKMPKVVILFRYFFLLLAGWATLSAASVAVQIATLEGYKFNVLTGLYSVINMVMYLMTAGWLVIITVYVLLWLSKLGRNVA